MFLIAKVIARSCKGRWREKRPRAEAISLRGGSVRQGLDLQVARLWQGWVRCKREEPPFFAVSPEPSQDVGDPLSQELLYNF